MDAIASFVIAVLAFTAGVVALFVTEHPLPCWGAVLLVSATGIYLYFRLIRPRESRHE